ncbi:hypothetical protein KIN20_022502 [Parelaphostrongylus tenuis]|uniref:Uncharacterized protein n=1 Tax=Parelaphostrongylus tenuis TaxID=148309 RepID=A0AAD5QVE0_PARTN|nr:hypothetical protein KIN20_022502 [Parelaphostrongylus tenuis]
MDVERNTDELVDHRTNSSGFKRSLADDNLLRKALHEHQCQCFDRASALEHQIAMVSQKSSELTAGIESVNANINHVANFKFIEQRLEEYYNSLAPLEQVLQDNSIGGKESTLIALTSAIRQGIEDIRNSQDISNVCLTPAIIGSSEFYSSIQSSALIPTERSAEQSTQILKSSVSPSTPQTRIECFGGEREEISTLLNGRRNDVQKKIEISPSSSIANFSTENFAKSLAGSEVLRHSPPNRHSPPDRLARVPIIRPTFNEDDVHFSVHTDRIKEKSENQLNTTSGKSVLANDDVLHEQ